MMRRKNVSNLFKAAVISLLLAPLCFARPAGIKNIKFYYFTVDQGLSQNTIQCILQDKRGFMWFGTMNGLNRFDGYKFTIFQPDAVDAGTISSNDIQAIVEDKNGKLWIGTTDGINCFDPLDGRFSRYKHIPGNANSLVDNDSRTIIQDREGFIWIGTKNGLNRFDPGTETFELFQHRPSDPYSPGHNDITVLLEDSKGLIWIGTSGGGLNRYDRTSGRFKRYEHDPQDANTLWHNTLRDLYIDRQGMLWISTGGGLDRFDPQTERFTHHNVGVLQSQGLKRNWITFVFEDSRDNLWVGTDGEGLFCFDRKKEEFYPVRSRASSESGLNSYRPTIMYEDRSGNLWIGTWDGGINLMEYSARVFLHHRNEPDNPASLGSNSVYQIDEDSKGNIWISTGRGISRYDPEQNKIGRFPDVPGYPAWIASEVFFALFIDDKDNIWGGTRDHGVVRIDTQNHRVVQYRHDPQKNSIRPGPIWAINGDHNGTIWIGMGGGGLNRLDPETGQIEIFNYEPGNSRSISNNVITSIVEDHQGLMWIGTRQGLNRFDPAAKQVAFTRFLSQKDDPTSISDNLTYSIYEDKEYVIWVGTSDGGLNRFDRTSRRFTHFTRKNGLPNDTIYGILGDEEGNLWLSTNNGMCKFNPKNLTVHCYDVEDGLQSNEFNLSAYKSSKGMMFFGGVNGFNAFYPEQIRNNPLVPPVYITGFKIFNEPVPIGPLPEGRTILKHHIFFTTDIQLNYKDRNISFDFAALNYIQPEKNRYAYIMENFEAKWNHTKQQRTASYTNLPPGRYVFRVKGSNNDGVWNEKGTMVKIHILAPFWQTWGFRVLITLIIGGIVAAVYQIKTRLLLKRKVELEKLVSQRTVELSQSNAALRESELKYRTVVERADEGILVLKDGIILYCNPQFIRWLGESEKNIVNRSFLDFIAGEEKQRVREQMQDYLKKGSNSFILETYLRLKKAEKLDVRISFGKIMYHHQAALLLFIQDTKTQKLLEAERFKTEKLESVGLLAGGISHDFNNLLAVILGNIQLAIIDIEADHPVYQVLKEIEKASLLASDLTQQFITFSRGGQPRLRTESLTEIIAESTRAIPKDHEKNKTIRCQCHIPRDIWPVTCDRSQVVWVIKNLVKNSIQAMPEGGTIEIKAENVSDIDITGETVKRILLSSTPGRYVKISVRDEGVGIPEEHIRKIFDPYFTTRGEVTKKGLGLGLAIVHSIIKSHSGAVMAESEVNVGTTIHIFLPTASNR
jgi:PAS domain S-box-containing protein